MEHPTCVSACGALGKYDHARVEAIAGRLMRRPTPVHSDARSILLLDRPAIEWRAGRRRGLGWCEQPWAVDGSGLRSWNDAAAAALAGLGISGRDRFLHTSDANLASVYWHAEKGAVYFASSVDALVSTAAQRLTVDWDCWAAILALGYPLGDRTPFAEIRRLGPATLLRERRGVARTSTERWAWAEHEPRLDLERGAPAVAESIDRAFARLPDGPLVCTLSGGLDSRICLSVLARQGRNGLRAMTVHPDDGLDREARVAAQVAATLGAPHEVVAGTPEEWWPDLELLARRLDYQFVRSPWRVPLLEPLRRLGGTVVDGFAFDTLAAAGDRFFPLETDDPRGGDAAVRGLWRALRNRQVQVHRGPVGFPAHTARALWASARGQFMAASEPLRGNPQRALLTFTQTRGARGVGQTAYAVFGAEMPLATPFLDSEVVRSALSISLASKRGGGLYRAVFNAIDPRMAALPNVGRGAKTQAAAVPRRGDSPPVTSALHASLADGPLTPLLSPGLLASLAGSGGKRPRRGINASIGPVYFHLWHERYRDRLGDCDPVGGWGL